MALASIPSPGHAAWRLGPLPIRAYALCVIAGIIVAVVVASRRYAKAGGQAGVILDVAAWAVPCGVAAACAHAVLIDTKHDFTHHAYGLWHAATVGVAAIGVPGAVALGAAGAWIACRRAGVRLGPVAAAAAPAIAFGLAVGGLGNWWTQQFYGYPSTWWWAVQISPEHRVPGFENYATFQPAFLYASLTDTALGFAVIWAARRFAQHDRALSGAAAIMLCAAGYAVGDFWVVSVRIGPLPDVLGIRYGQLADIAVFVLAVAGMYVTRSRRKPSARTSSKRALENSSDDVMSM
jgi:prolipoprotein diacylglyceryltransferase